MTVFLKVMIAFSAIAIVAGVLFLLGYRMFRLVAMVCEKIEEARS